MPDSPQNKSWLNRTVLGVGLTSLFSDWSHETATAVLPAFLAAIGAGPVWLGAIEGISDGLFRLRNARLSSAFRPRRRVAGPRSAFAGKESFARRGRSAKRLRSRLWSRAP